MALGTIGRNQLNTGIDDNSDATAITIDSSERVGIGTASPLSDLHQDIALSDREGHHLYYGTDAKAAFTVLPNTGEIRIGAATAGTSGNYYTEIMSRNGSNLVTSIKADAYGRTTIPNQPLFVATSPIVGTSGALTADTDVRYKRWTTVLFNIGSHFNNASGGGFFTAPVAGRYYVMFKAGHKVTYNAWNGMYLFKNSTNLLVFWDPPDSSSNGAYNSNNASIVLTLAANDTCGVGYHTNYSDLSANSNNFISIGLLH